MSPSSPAITMAASWVVILLVGGDAFLSLLQPSLATDLTNPPSPPPSHHVEPGPGVLSLADSDSGVHHHSDSHSDSTHSASTHSDSSKKGYILTADDDISSQIAALESDIANLTSVLTAAGVNITNATQADAEESSSLAKARKKADQIEFKISEKGVLVGATVNVTTDVLDRMTGSDKAKSSSENSKSSSESFLEESDGVGVGVDRSRDPDHDGDSTRDNYSGPIEHVKHSASPEAIGPGPKPLLSSRGNHEILAENEVS
jgi:hypothetical protein